MSTYEINLSYTAANSTRVTLPDGKTWDDVLDWYIKYNTLNFRLKGEDEYREIELDFYIEIDTKYPNHTCIVPVDANGDADYENPVVED